MFSSLLEHVIGDIKNFVRFKVIEAIGSHHRKAEVSLSFRDIMKHKIAPIAFFLAMVVGCGEQKINTVEEGEVLMQISRDWSRSVSPDSIERVMSYWADDAVYMAPGQSAIIGKEVIRQMVKESLKIPGFKISWEPKVLQYRRAATWPTLSRKVK